MNCLKDIGEHNAIAALTANLKAVGDDCAVLPNPGSGFDLILTSDPLIEGGHFDETATPEQIGHKAICRVLSDFAAMGSEPQYLLINVVASPEQPFDVLEKIYVQFDVLKETYGAEVVGGDLAQGPALELHVFGVGRVPTGTAVLRSTANAGDAIYVTGPLGCAQKSGKQFTFEPRLTWGDALRASGDVTAMMDISDGVATDLRHILNASSVGAALESAKIPCNGTLREALVDGEDFELVFTVAADRVDAFEARSQELFGQRFHRIGTLTDCAKELLLDGESIEGKAFEHFRS